MSNINEEPETVPTPDVTTTGSSRTSDDNDTAYSINNDNQGINRNQTNYVGSNEKNWGGAKPEVGAVLGLKVENLNKKYTS